MTEEDEIDVYGDRKGSMEFEPNRFLRQYKMDCFGQVERSPSSKIR